MLAALGIGRSEWTTDGVQVAEEHQWKNDSNVLVGHRATTALTVTVRSTELVSAVIRDGVTDAGASVRSLTWRVDADNPARAALLGAAARDALFAAVVGTVMRNINVLPVNFFTLHGVRISVGVRAIRNSALTLRTWLV